MFVAPSEPLCYVLCLCLYKRAYKPKPYPLSHNFVITNLKKQKHRLLSQSKKQNFFNYLVTNM